MSSFSSAVRGVSFADTDYLILASDVKFLRTLFLLVCPSRAVHCCSFGATCVRLAACGMVPGKRGLRISACPGSRSVWSSGGAGGTRVLFLCGDAHRVGGGSDAVCALSLCAARRQTIACIAGVRRT